MIGQAGLRLFEVMNRREPGLELPGSRLHPAGVGWPELGRSASIQHRYLMYLDTAILVKLFVREPDSEFFGALVDDQPVTSSAIAFTEVWSALLGKERAHALTAAQRRRAWEAFESHLEEETIRLEPLSPALLGRANRILEECHPGVALRSLDALHLATADRLQEWPLCTTDHRMREAAKVLRFPLNELPG